MAENKTQATNESVAKFINTIADERQRADAKAISAMMERLSGEPPTMWGSSIIGFGRYHYKYESGREGDSLRIGFSPRKGSTVLYIVDGFSTYDAIMSRLGKFKTGKSCLYIKQLADVDESVLEALIAASVAQMDEKYSR